MKDVLLISAALPPAHDGIGDYTARLAEALAADSSLGVRVWTAADGARPDEIDGVEVDRPFSLGTRRGVWGIYEALGRAERDGGAGELPGAVVLQFNQFSWGRWGLNLELPRVMRAIKKRWGCTTSGGPGVKTGVMFHEKIVPPATWKFRIMRLWQVRQYNALADLADVRFFSIQRWADEERQRRPDRPAEDTVHLPVGSNLPYCSPDQAKSREELGIPDEALVCGVFGSAHPSRLLDWVAAAVAELRRQGHDAWLLYIGGDGDAVRHQCEAVSPDLPLIDTGRLPAPEAAACFNVMDLYLSPFIDGLSTRRGSAMAALQHGIPVVSTKGPLTDDLFLEADGEAIILGDLSSEVFTAAVQFAAAPDRRARLGPVGQTLYRRTADWPVIAERVAEEAGTGGIPETATPPSTTNTQRAVA